MSQSPYIPHDPGSPLASPPLAYATGSSAPTLVMLAGVFNAVLAGLSLFMGIGCAIGAIVAPILMRAELASSTDPPPLWVFPLIYGGIGLLALIAGCIYTVAAFKFLKKRPNACTWGMIAGITACLNLWCGGACVIPMACGIFTIVVSSQSAVKTYLANLAQNSGN